MSSPKFLPTEVNPSGLTNLIVNLGRDCSPTQFLREFTKNAIEACQRTGAPSSKVVIDYNQRLYAQLKLHKICFIDTGDGMSGEQMIHLLNYLSASGAKNEHANYGVGAKISALTRNHAGIQYDSWKDGQGHRVYIRYNSEDGIYGIQGAQAQDGTSYYAIPLTDEEKPGEISAHGTCVTLWGMEDQQDTMKPPEGVPGIRESWLALYLNSRFFRIPDGIEISARIGYYRENNPRHNYLLAIRGQKAILDEKSELKGEVKLSDAKVYWWVMPKGIDGHGREQLKGHTALINENEIFDVSDARSNRAAFFGVIMGRDRVIIYVEPQNLVQNTARTNLVRPDGSVPSWDKWADEFRGNMPSELKRFLDDLLEQNAADSHTDSIKERLKSIKELYKLSRYKANPKGTLFADPNSEASFGTGHILAGDRNAEPPRTSSSGRGTVFGSLSTALLTALVDKTIGVKAADAQPDPFPRVEWVHASPEENEALLDRAAEYIQTSNLILANKDFQGLRDLVEYFSKNYANMPEVVSVIEDEVKQSFEQALTECVAGALSFQNRPKWNPSDFEKAISPEALTTAVMPRYWMVTHIRRVLGSKIKGFS